jgi:hypothetical protein
MRNLLILFLLTTPVLSGGALQVVTSTCTLGSMTITTSGICSIGTGSTSTMFLYTATPLSYQLTVGVSVFSPMPGLSVGITGEVAFDLFTGGSPRPRILKFTGVTDVNNLASVALAVDKHSYIFPQHGPVFNDTLVVTLGLPIDVALYASTFASPGPGQSGPIGGAGVAGITNIQIFESDGFTPVGFSDAPEPSTLWPAAPFAVLALAVSRLIAGGAGISRA